MKNLKYLLIVFLVCIKSIGQKKFLIEYDYSTTNYNCSSQLFVSDKEAVYRINDKRESGLVENEDRLNFVYNDKMATYFYSTNKESYTRIPLFDGEVKYVQDNKDLKFQLTGNTKIIGNYNCNEATLKLNNRDYVIWFTSDVNVNYGPYKINGLPGLILELKELTNNITISLKSIKELKETKIFEEYKSLFLSKKVLSYPEYETKMTKIMTSKKSRDIAYYAENGATMEYNKDQSFFTQHIIDIPKNLVEELQKIN